MGEHGSGAAAGHPVRTNASIVSVHNHSSGRVGIPEYTAEHDWLTIGQLSSYAPDLNPVEGIRSLVRRGFTGNVGFTDADHLVRTIRHGLRHIQRRLPRRNRPHHPTQGMKTNPPTSRRKPQECA